jgi:hypothetical protein
MAKTQTFADKAKGKQKSAHVNVKFIKTIKDAKGNYKFQERIVKLDDINQVTQLK